jgi:hypothetical protein
MNLSKILLNEFLTYDKKNSQYDPYFFGKKILHPYYHCYILKLLENLLKSLSNKNKLLYNIGYVISNFEGNNDVLPVGLIAHVNVATDV